MTDQELVGMLDRIGGWVRESEIRRQLHKRGVEWSEADLLTRLASLEGEARVRSERYFTVGKGAGVKRGRPEAVPGYDYAAFCQAIADRDGVDCWLRRNVEMPPELRACSGQLDGHHLLAKSWLKSSEAAKGQWPSPPHATGRATAEEGPGFVRLSSILNDHRNGVLACRRHHDLLENARITLRRADLPAHVEEFAAELGDRAVGRLERNFGRALQPDRSAE